jgi:hypothetical protein
MPKHPDNLFDDDDALDCMIYDSLERENNKQPKNNRGRGGCLGLILLLGVPVGLLVPFCLQFFRL